ncbi:MAG: DHA2 family efflux MFS transporter permease subunit [Cyanobacteria bacterium P01_H01_bin.121]
MATTSAVQTGWLKWAIAFTVSLAAMLETVDTSIVNVALTDMQAGVGATVSQIGWVVTGYAIGNVIMIPLSAWLGDTFGKKRYFVFSMLGFTLASAACGAATNLTTLIVARVIQGLLGGGLLAKAQTFLFETFPPEEHGMAQAMFGVGVITGPAIGPTLGGFLADDLSWRWVFYVNLPIGALAVLASTLFLPVDRAKSANATHKVDWWGISLLIIMLGSFQTFLEQGEQNDWFESASIRGLAIAAAIGFGLFVWRELTTPKPAVDLRTLRHRSLAAGSLYMMVLGLGLYGLLFAVPIFTQSVLGFNAQRTGLLLMPGALMSALMMPIMGKLNRFDPRILIGLGSIILSCTCFALARINIDTGTPELFWPLLLRGLGTTMMFLPLSLATLSRLPPADLASGSGFFNLTRQLGGSIGIALLTTVLDRREAFHRAILAGDLSLYSPATQQRLDTLTATLQQRGIDPTTAHQQALALLDQTLSTQAAILSFADLFRGVGLLFLAAIPLLFLLGKSGTTKPSLH